MAQAIQMKDTLVCPFSHAQSDGSEAGIGWVCKGDCQILMPRLAVKGAVTANDYFLPEYLCEKPMGKDGKPRPECLPSNMKEIEEQYHERQRKGAP